MYKIVQNCLNGPEHHKNIVIIFEKEYNIHSDSSFVCLFSELAWLYSVFCMALACDH